MGDETWWRTDTTFMSCSRYRACIRTERIELSAVQTRHTHSKSERINICLNGVCYVRLIQEPEEQVAGANSETLCSCSHGRRLHILKWVCTCVFLLMLTAQPWFVLPCRRPSAIPRTCAVYTITKYAEILLGMIFPYFRLFGISLRQQFAFQSLFWYSVRLFCVSISDICCGSSQVYLCKTLGTGPYTHRLGKQTWLTNTMSIVTMTGV
jgi:hypothetical protein